MTIEQWLSEIKATLNQYPGIVQDMPPAIQAIYTACFDPAGQRLNVDLWRHMHPAVWGELARLFWRCFGLDALYLRRDLNYCEDIEQGLMFQHLTKRRRIAALETGVDQLKNQIASYMLHKSEGENEQ